MLSSEHSRLPHRISAMMFSWPGVIVVAFFSGYNRREALVMILELVLVLMVAVMYMLRVIMLALAHAESPRLLLTVPLIFSG